MTAKGWSILGGLVFLALTLLFFGDNLVGDPQPTDLKPKTSIAQITEVRGAVRLRAHGQLKDQLLSQNSTAPYPIYHLDQLKVERGASAIVVFTSKYEIRLNELTRVNFELWDPESPNSPSFLHFLEGDFELETQGKLGQLYMVREGQAFVPSQKPEQDERVLVVESANEEPSSKPGEEVLAPENTETPEDTTPDEAAVRGIPKTSPPKILGQNGSLSNEYLKEKLRTQAHLFRKCQTNSLRANQSATGDLLVSMKVSPNGEVSKIKVIQTSIKDSQMQECAISVLERMRFHAFNGPDVLVTYPLKFR